MPDELLPETVLLGDMEGYAMIERSQKQSWCTDYVREDLQSAEDVYALVDCLPLGHELAEASSGC